MNCIQDAEPGQATGLTHLVGQREAALRHAEPPSGPNLASSLTRGLQRVIPFMLFLLWWVLHETSKNR